MSLFIQVISQVASLKRMGTPCCMIYCENDKRVEKEVSEELVQMLGLKSQPLDEKILQKNLMKEHA